MFLNLNEGFFGGAICTRRTTVRFGTNKECNNAYGHTDSFIDTILINNELQHMKKFTTISLLHEMSHLALYQGPYIGYEGYGGHHTRFYALIDRLYQAGAYEGLL